MALIFMRGGKNVFGASASGGMTSHYLNPVVIQNYTNRGTLGDFSADCQRDLSPKDRLSFIVRHELSRYQLLNEQLQQAAGNRRRRTISKPWGLSHLFSTSIRPAPAPVAWLTLTGPEFPEIESRFRGEERG